MAGVHGINNVIFFSIIITGIILIQCCWCRPNDNENFLKWTNHKAMVSSYKCGNPQPKNMNLAELLAKDQHKSNRKDIWPRSTILHRCNSSGCCTDFNKECKSVPDTEKQVNLTFAILKKPSIEYFTISAINHTSCSCQDVKEKPEK